MSVKEELLDFLPRVHAEDSFLPSGALVHPLDRFLILASEPTLPLLGGRTGDPGQPGP